MFSGAYSLLGLITDWDEISDANRAQAIMELVADITEGLDYAVEAWKAWKGRSGMYAIDQLDTTDMDQGTDRAPRRKTLVPSI
ncbi:hypothetical protein BJX76DRAFT_341864 [Aspergillus varians]